MIISVVYLLVRCLLGCPTVLTRRQMSKDAELLVLRHENAVLRREISLWGSKRGTGSWPASMPAVMVAGLAGPLACDGTDAVAQRPPLCSPPVR